MRICALICAFSIGCAFGQQVAPDVPELVRLVEQAEKANAPRAARYTFRYTMEYDSTSGLLPGGTHVLRTYEVDERHCPTLVDKQGSLPGFNRRPKCNAVARHPVSLAQYKDLQYQGTDSIGGRFVYVLTGAGKKFRFAKAPRVKLCIDQADLIVAQLETEWEFAGTTKTAMTSFRDESGVWLMERLDFHSAHKKPTPIPFVFWGPGPEGNGITTFSNFRPF